MLDWKQKQQRHKTPNRLQLWEAEFSVQAHVGSLVVAELGPELSSPDSHLVSFSSQLSTPEPVLITALVSWENGGNHVIQNSLLVQKVIYFSHEVGYLFIVICLENHTEQKQISFQMIFSFNIKAPSSKANAGKGLETKLIYTIDTYPRKWVAGKLACLQWCYSWNVNQSLQALLLSW